MVNGSTSTLYEHGKMNCQLVSQKKVFFLRPVGSTLDSTFFIHPILIFYICGSMHPNSRLKKSNKVQQYADIYLLLNYSTCFGRPSHPSSGVHKTVVAASSTDHTIWGARFFKRDQIRTHLVTFEEACSPDSMIFTRGCNCSFMYS